MNNEKSEVVINRQYELMMILPQGSEEVKKENQDKIKESLTKKNIEISEEKELYSRKFYHPIKKQAEGLYIIYSLTANPAAIFEIQKEFRLNQNILRYQFIKK
jgi:small subunit ribosomal protein S6